MKILVLEACGLHAGFVGCYGNDWVATPNVDRLAAEGIAFDQHILDRPELSLETELGARSAGTGRYGNAQTRPSLGFVQTLPCPTWDDFIAARGAVGAWHRGDTPVLWIEGPNLVPPWALADDLLDTYCVRGEDEQGEEVAAWPAPPLGSVELSQDDVVRLQDTYAAVVTYWDALVGALLDELRGSGRLDELNLCVTARSGLPLGEHDVVGPGPGLYDELVHVPLVWRMPHATEAGLRISALTQPVDLLPTMCDLLGLPLPDAQGSTLRPLMLGQAADIRPYACAVQGEEWLLRTPEWAFHLPAGNGARLYVKPDDRWEANDVSQRQPEVVERLERTLRRFSEKVAEPGPLEYPLPE